MAILLRSVVGQPVSSIAGGSYKSWTRTATGAGTWSVPPGYKGIIFVTLVGGGAGGGSVSAAGYEGGGGGGGVTYFRWPLWIDYEDATSYTVTVGAGGSSGNGATGDGSVGGTTSFGTRLYAYGGGGGGGRTNGCDGGQGGLFSGTGATNVIGQGAANARINAELIEPMHAAIGMSFRAEGGNGGPGYDNITAASVGQSTLGGLPDASKRISHIASPVVGFGGTVVPLHDTLYGATYGLGQSNDTFTGGGSYGYGGNTDATPDYAPQTNGGGGGAGEQNNSANEQAGAAGFAAVEYFL